jgi:hypothetical protein
MGYKNRFLIGIVRKVKLEFKIDMFDGFQRKVNNWTLIQELKLIFKITDIFG